MLQGMAIWSQVIVSSGFCLSFVTVSFIAVLVAIINCTGLAYRQGIDRFKLHFILSLDDASQNSSPHLTLFMEVLSRMKLLKIC